MKKDETEEPKKKRTYFEAISEGRTSRGEKIDPHKVVICGVDKETAEVAAQGEEEAREVESLTMPTSREIKAFLEDADKFFETWPVQADANYMRGLLEGVLQNGSNLKPIVGRRVGGFICVNDGRHNAAAVRKARECLSGKCHIKAVEGLVRRLLKERGRGWLPILIAMPPATDAETGEALPSDVVADLSQVVRVPTLPEMYDRALRRVRAARSQESKPDFASIARDFNQTASTIEGWERLSKMPRVVRDYVLVGHEGRRFPLSSALALAGLPDDLMVAKVQAMLAEGDTRVATAKATARGVAEASDRDPPVKGDRGAAAGGAGDAAPPSSNATATDSSTPRDEDGDATLPSETRRAPWKVRDAAKFLKADTLNGDDQASFAAITKLFTESPDALTAADFRALGSIGKALKSYLKKSSK